MRTLLLTAVSILALGLNTTHAITYTLSGPLDALQAGTNGGFGAFDMVAAGAGNGTGTIAGNYDDATKLLNYTIIWQDLTADITNMHFHAAPAGASAGVDLGIPGPWSSPYVGTDIAIDAAKETNLLAGNWYVNIHTSNFTGGEIRGQVLVAPIPEPTTAALAAAAILSLVGVARRRRQSILGNR